MAFSAISKKKEYCLFYLSELKGGNVNLHNKQHLNKEKNPLYSVINISPIKLEEFSSEFFILF